MIPLPRTDASLARRAAVALAALLTLVAGFQAFWALGGTWGMSEALGGEIEENSPLLRVASAVVALFLVGAALVVLVHVGLLRRRLPFSVVRWGPWTLTVLLVFIGLNNLAAETSWERFAWGPLALVVALLSALVALSPPRDATDRRQTAPLRDDSHAGVRAEGPTR